VTTTPLLDVTGLQKSFLSPDGDTTLIVDVPRFQLAEGEQVAVRGASGSGKTTFLNLIAGILQADKGTIVLAGQTITALSESGRDRLRAKTIGYVFQNFNLLQGYTAIENVMLGMLFGSGVDRARAQQLLERVGLSHRINYRPSQLSIGQQQRVAVARALANRPKLVLADEPTGNLDQRHAGEALELIREACRENGAALLLVSHDPAVLALFDRSEDLADLNQAAAAHAAAPVHTENRTAL
jgi:ABC-type lipoprotein export system ATPase subunit